MIALQSMVTPGSPAKESHHESPSKNFLKPTTTLGRFTRHLSKFRDEKGSRSGTSKLHDKAASREIKMLILKRNPYIYGKFRERLPDRYYTNWGAAHELALFLDNELRIPDLKDDITNRLVHQPSRGGLMSYLKGDVVPLTPKKKHCESHGSTLSSGNNTTPTSHASFTPSSVSTGKPTISYIDEDEGNRLSIPILDMPEDDSSYSAQSQSSSIISERCDI